MEEPRFRRDLYKGTAADYDRYRPRYPAALLTDLLSRTGLDAGGRLLDVACGTGQIAFDVAPHFSAVRAIDQEPETVEFAARKAMQLGVTNIEFEVAAAETYDLGAERVDLVTIGNAFHRLPRRDTARAAHGWVRSGGYLALLWGGTPFQGAELDPDEAEWQRAIASVMQNWMAMLGEERIPPTLQHSLDTEPHETILEAAGFDVLGKWEFLQPYTWSVETLTGFLYSTSVLPRVLVGDRAPEFEADVRDALLAAEPSGVFRHELSFACELARSR